MRAIATILLVAVLGQIHAVEVPTNDAAPRCAALTALQLGPTRITKAEILSGDVSNLFPAPSANDFNAAEALSNVAPFSKLPSDLPRFCRVALVSSYSTDSTVHSEVWLPVSSWNGRFLGTGNGGFGGTIYYNPLAAGLYSGFAVANTDLGTSTEAPSSTSVASGHPIKWYDYGWRATHGMTVAAKAIIRQFYGVDAQHAYFQGCSAGGYQALRNAQFFPDDYDGILAGNAGNVRAAKVIAQTYYGMLPKLHPQGRLSDAKLMTMHQAVLKQCAGVGGGLKDDPFLANPYACRWKPESLLCQGVETDRCLTPAQVDLANQFYGPIVFKSTGKAIWPGRPPGTELGWSSDMHNAEVADPPHAAVVRSILGEGHDFWKSDWDRDIDTYLKIQGFLWGDGENTDLSAFQKRGGKLLSYFGWSDPSTSYDMTGYYDALEADVRRRGHLTAEQAAQATRQFTRLFLVPGMGHCVGGPGPNTFDALTPLMKWVEEGQAPERIEAKWEGQPDIAGASLGRPMTRPLCVYPEVAHYSGHGNPNEAANFICKR